MYEPVIHEHTPVTVDEILQRYRAGDRDFRQSELPDGASFRGQDLSGAIFDGSWIFAADFSHATLRGVSFRTSNVKCCDFSGADLTGVDFRGAGIDAGIFTMARLVDIRLEGATAYGFVLRDDTRLVWQERPSMTFDLWLLRVALGEARSSD